MSEEEDNHTPKNALAIIAPRPFKMPVFKHNADHLQSQLNEVYSTTKLDIKNYVETESQRAKDKFRIAIEQGTMVLGPQKDFARINARIVAWNKKVELERKIRHMGINEGVLRKSEMNEKLRLLNENIKYLELQELPDDMGSEREEAEGEDSQSKLKSRGNNRRSVEVIRYLEDQIGLPISTKNARVMNYKDKMHVTKEEFLKSQESATQFVASIQDKKKKFEQKMKEIKKKSKFYKRFGELFLIIRE